MGVLWKEVRGRCIHTVCGREGWRGGTPARSFSCNACGRSRRSASIAPQSTKIIVPEEPAFFATAFGVGVRRGWLRKSPRGESGRRCEAWRFETPQHGPCGGIHFWRKATQSVLSSLRTLRMCPHRVWSFPGVVGSRTRTASACWPRSRGSGKNGTPSAPRPCTPSSRPGSTTRRGSSVAGHRIAWASPEQ